jgi:hypothetical protein
VPAKIRRESRISPLYASLGPMRSAAMRLLGDAERVDAVRAEHAAWRGEWLEQWQQNDPAAPRPPYADLLDMYARPAG